MPPPVLILLIWPVACLIFYLADHTMVQTRYCLLSMPGVSIATLWLIDDSDRPLLLRARAALMVLVSVVTLWIAVIPHVENKKEGVRILSDLSAFIRDRIPRGAPVAVYAIGEIAFESRQPLVDTGGITRPGVIPYLNDPQATLRWAKENGAQYFIGSGAPEPGAIPVFSAAMPFFGWTLHRSLYRMTEPIVVYKLP